MRAGLFSAVHRQRPIQPGTRWPPLIHKTRPSHERFTPPTHLGWSSVRYCRRSVVQPPLYASLATSLVTPFLAMRGKQWANHYLRNRDRRRELGGLEAWRFRLVTESLPVVL